MANPSMPSEIAQATPREIISIQYLRGVAAIMVALHHAWAQFPRVHAWFPTEVGSTGVDIFFVISGFVMTYTTGRRPIGAGEFLLKRVVRIVPLYWLLTLVTAAMLLAAPGLVQRSVFELSSLVMSLLFIPHWNPADHGSFSPMLKLGWTLNFEMMFYLVFSLFLTLGLKLRIALIALIFVGFVALRQVLGDGWGVVAVYGSPMVFEFLFGCLLGMLELRGSLSKCSRATSIMFVVGGAFALFHGAKWVLYDWRVLTCGIPALFIVAGFAALERGGARFSKNGLLALLGDASYSIYLSHLYAVVFFRIVWTKLGLPVDTLPTALAFLAACATVGVSTGVAVYFLIERPMTRGLNAFIRARSAPPPVATPA